MEVDPTELLAADEAARWYLRLEDGVTPGEYRSFMQWLRASPCNAGAMTFMYRLCGSLQRHGNRNFSH